MVYEERMRTIGLCLALGLAAGGVLGCMFETEFLLYAGCQNAEVHCDGAWGEKRDPQYCFWPKMAAPEGGYCTALCDETVDCPAGDGAFADAPKKCVEARVHREDDGMESANTGKEGTEEWARQCVLACDTAKRCPAGMTCDEYPLKDGSLMELCFLPVVSN